MRIFRYFAFASQYVWQCSNSYPNIFFFLNLQFLGKWIALTGLNEYILKFLWKPVTKLQFNSTNCQISMEIQETLLVIWYKRYQQFWSFLAVMLPKLNHRKYWQWLSGINKSSMIYFASHAFQCWNFNEICRQGSCSCS